MIPKSQKLSFVITSGVDGAHSWFSMADRLADGASFLKSPSPPSIKSMIEIAMISTPHNGAFAIVNSDIILSDKILGIRYAAKQSGLSWAATSFRWEFSGNEKQEGLDVVEGQGIDIFVMTPTVAKHVLKEIPDFFTMGRGGWDNWMCGWLRKNLAESRFYDFTHWRCVHHERHPTGSGRFPPFTEEQSRLVLHNVSHKGIPDNKLHYPL